MSAQKLNSDTRLSRREWLTGVTALAASAVTSERHVLAQGAATRPYRIDTHHHYTGNNWAPGRTIEAMDQVGIATAILSRPGIPLSEPEPARRLARETNDYGARLVRDYPGRFGLFATLPLFDVEGSLREIAYGFDVLRTDGVCLVTSYGNKWAGDPAFAPVFDELNRRKAVVFVHPTTPPCCVDITLKTEVAELGVRSTALENQFDTARGIVSLVLNGTLYRCPDIRFIFCHGGGALPTLHERLDHLIGDDQSSRTDGGSDGGYRSKYVPNGFDHEIKKLYFDVVRVANPANFAMLRQLIPPDHLLFGTDFPPVPMSETASRLQGLRLDAPFLRGIERDNALTLFPRFKA
jgi:predicted TIM-barrel fold metal-dependent hydrolase